MFNKSLNTYLYEARKTWLEEVKKTILADKKLNGRVSYYDEDIQTLRIRNTKRQSGEFDIIKHVLQFGNLTIEQIIEYIYENIKYWEYGCDSKAEYVKTKKLEEAKNNIKNGKKSFDYYLKVYVNNLLNNGMIVTLLNDSVMRDDFLNNPKATVGLLLYVIPPDGVSRKIFMDETGIILPRKNSKTIIKKIIFLPFNKKLIRLNDRHPYDLKKSSEIKPTHEKFFFEMMNGVCYLNELLYNEVLEKCKREVAIKFKRAIK